MTELILFHHGHGLTAGVRALADDFRAAGHQVHVPDLFEGRTFADLAEGVGHAEEVGFGTILKRGRLAAEEEAPRAELFLYPGGRHLFTDNSLPDHDDAAAALVEERVLSFLDAIG